MSEGLRFTHSVVDLNHYYKNSFIHRLIFSNLIYFPPENGKLLAASSKQLQTSQNFHEVFFISQFLKNVKCTCQHFEAFGTLEHVTEQTQYQRGRPPFGNVQNFITTHGNISVTNQVPTLKFGTFKDTSKIKKW